MNNVKMVVINNHQLIIDILKIKTQKQILKFSLIQNKHSSHSRCLLSIGTFDSIQTQMYTQQTLHSVI